MRARHVGIFAKQRKARLREDDVVAGIDERNEGELNAATSRADFRSARA
jgi:hypothetical protein